MDTPEETKDINKQNKRYALVGWGVILIGISTCVNTYYIKQIESKLYVRPSIERLREQLDPLKQCIEDKVLAAQSSLEISWGVQDCLEKYSK